MRYELDTVKEELADLKTWTQNICHKVNASARDVAVLMDQFRYHSLHGIPKLPNTG